MRPWLLCSADVSQFRVISLHTDTNGEKYTLTSFCDALEMVAQGRREDAESTYNAWDIQDSLAEPVKEAPCSNYQHLLVQEVYHLWPLWLIVTDSHRWWSREHTLQWRCNALVVFYCKDLPGWIQTVGGRADLLMETMTDNNNNNNNSNLRELVQVTKCEAARHLSCDLCLGGGLKFIFL